MYRKPSKQPTLERGDYKGSINFFYLASKAKICEIVKTASSSL